MSFFLSTERKSLRSRPTTKICTPSLFSLSCCCCCCCCCSCFRFSLRRSSDEAVSAPAQAGRGTISEQGGSGAREGDRGRRWTVDVAPPPSSLVCPLLFPSKSRAKGPSAVPRCLDSLSRSQRRLSPTVLKKKLKQAPASVVISTPKDALNDIAGLGPCAAAAAASKQQRRSSASFGGLVRALSRSPIGGSAGGAGALADSCEMSPKSAQTDEERGEKRRVDREKNGLEGGGGGGVVFGWGRVLVFFFGGGGGGGQPQPWRRRPSTIETKSDVAPPPPF